MNFVLPATDKLFKPETIRIEWPGFFQHVPPNVAGRCRSLGIKKKLLMRKKRKHEEGGVFGIILGDGMGRGSFRAGANDYHL
jgi:hypothetical protein